MFVAASTDCFPGVPLDEALSRLVDLEFNRVEIGIHAEGPGLRPADVLADLDRAIAQCRNTQRLTPVAFAVDPDPGENYYRQFAACCKLAKATKVVTITVRSGELGTPFNAEIERLRELAAIAIQDGVVLGVLTQEGRISQDPNTAVVLCQQVKGLGITLDPSPFICGPHKGDQYNNVFKHVVHTHLRDTTKDKMQVRIGQGEIEYSRLITQLSLAHYNRALCVHITPMDDVDHVGEMRKMRLLLESHL
ncbi:MAG TPA: sugar phosphate isomerase/epimerase [Pirellulales bacterium]|nr:sugar phosphate isomerase/epimerase [Pirellulales bacterium]